MVRSYQQPAEGISVSVTRNAQRANRNSKRSRRMGRALLLAAGLAVAGTLALPTGARATTQTWNGTTNGDWNTATNWSTGVPGAGDTALFNNAGNGNTSITFSAASSVLNITFDTSSVAAYTVGTTGGDALTLGAGGAVDITSGVTNAQIINEPLVLGGNYTFENNSATAATLAIGGTITNNAAATLTLTGTNIGTQTISGIISNGTGTTSLYVTGSNWNLTGINTYTGGTTVGAGAGFVYFNNGSAFGAGTITLDAGALAYTGAGSATVANAVTIGSAGYSEIDSNDNTATTLTLSGRINNSGNAGYTLILNAGTFDLTSSGNSSNFTGGTLEIGGGNATTVEFSSLGNLPGSGAYIALNGGELGYVGSGTYNVASGINVRANGSVIDAGGQQLNLNGRLSDSGYTLTLQNGKISLGSYNNSTNFTGGTLVIGDGTHVTKVYFGASATHGSADYLPAAAVPIELNNGTLKYTASGSYAGYVNNPITVDSTGGVVNAGGGADSLFLGGAITDSSSGTLILHDGIIVLNTGNSGTFTTGTLQIGNGSGASVVQFSSGGHLPGTSAGITLDQGELQYTGGGSVIVGNNITTSTGTGNIIDVNNQTVTLTGDLSGSGNLEAKDITAGTLELNPTIGNNVGFTGTLDINNSGGAVTLALDSQNAVTGGGITFDGGELLNNSGGTLTFAVANALTVNAGGGTIDTNGQDNVFNGTITGSGALTFNGGGTAELHGDSSLTYSGNVTIDPTTVIFYNAGSFGTGSVTLGPGGGELEAGASGVTLPNDIVLSDAILSGTPDVYSTAGFTDTLTGTISGAGGLVVTGGGQVNLSPLSGGNTYTGGTLIGDITTVGFNSSTSFGTGDITIDSTRGEIQYLVGGLDLQNNITLNGAGIIDAGGSINETYSGTITDGTASTLLVQNGTVNLTGTNDVTFATGTLQIGNGTGVASGNVVQFSSTNNLPAGTVPILLDIGELQYIGASNVTVNNPIQLNPGTNYIDVNGVTMFYTGVISDGPGGPGSLDAINSSAVHPGSLVLSNMETYSGATTVGFASETQNVTLTLAAGGTLYNGGVTPNSNLTVLANGIFNIDNGMGQTVNSLTGPAGGQILLTSGSLVVNNGNGDVFAGTISGGGGFTLNGTTGLNLAGANTYTGGTTINGGVLDLTTGGSLANSGNLAVNAAGTFIIANGVGQTVGTLDGAGRIDLTSGGLTVDNGGSFSGGITGNGGLTLNAPNGPDTLTLSGTSNYTGLTTIGSGATLDLSGTLGRTPIIVAGGTFNVLTGGSFSGPLGLAGVLVVNNNLSIGDFTGTSGSSVVLNSSYTLTVNTAAADSYGGAISGGGNLTVVGPNGSLDLTGDLSGYTGLTTIENGGTLGILLADRLPAADAFTFGTGGGQLNLFDGGSTTLGPITVLGPTTIDGGGLTNTVTLAGLITDASGSTLILQDAQWFQLANSGNSSPGGFTTGTLQVGGGAGPNNGTTVKFLSSADLPASTVGITLDAGELQYTGGSATPIGNNITVNGSSGNIIDANGVNALTLNGDLLGSGTLELTNGVIALSGSNNSFNGILDLNDKQGAVGVDIQSTTALLGASAQIMFDGGTLGNTSGNLTGANSIASALVVNDKGGTIDTAGNTTTLSGAISGTGPLTLTDSVGGGTIDITNTNTGYTGATTIENGLTVGLGASNALGSGGGNNTITIGANSADTGTLRYDVGSITLANNITLAGSGTIDLNGNTESYAGVISGGGGLTVTGGSTLTLSQVETYTGATAVNATTTLALSGSGSIAGSSDVTVNGRLDVSGITADGTSITSLAGSGTVALGSKSLTLSNADDAFSGAIGGTGGLVLTTGSETLSGSNAYTGGTTINGGTLDVAGSLASAGDVNVNGGEFEVGNSFGIANLNGSSTSTLDLLTGTLTVNPTTTDIFAGRVIGGGDLTVNGTGGSLTLSGDLSGFTGAFDATNGGSLIIGGHSQLSSSATFNITNNLSIGVTYDNLNGNAVNFGTATAAGGTLNVTGTPGSAATLGSGSNAISILDTATGTFTDTIDAGGATNSLTLAGALTSNNTTGANVLVLQNGIFDLANLTNSTSFVGNGTLQIGNGTSLAARAEFDVNTNLPGSTVGITLDSGELQYIGNPATTVGNTITVLGASGDIIDAGGLSGLNTLRLSGPLVGGSTAALQLTNGNIELSGSNSGFSGTLDLSAKGGAVTVLVDSNAALPGGGITFDGGTLENNSSASLNVTNNFTVNAAGGTYNDNVSGGTGTHLRGNITGPGSFAIEGVSQTSDYVELNGTNSPGSAATPGFIFENVAVGALTAANLGPNQIDLNNGTLVTVGFTGYTAANNIDLVGDGELDINSGLHATYTGAVTGAGTLTLSTNSGGFGPGTIELANAGNSYGTSTRGTIIENGVTAQFDSGTSFGAYLIQMGAGGFAGATLQPGANDSTLSNAISLSDSPTSGTPDVYNTNGLTSALDGVISGTGGLLIKGGGVVTLGILTSVPNTYSGGTIIDGSTTAIFANAGSFGTGSVTLGPGGGVLEAGASGVILPNDIVLSDAISGTPDIYSTGSSLFTDTLTGTIAGTGGLVVTGGGTVNLNGANTYTGGTLIQDQTTVGLNNSSGFGATSGGITIDSTGGAIKYTAPSLNIANALTLNGNGAIDVNGFGDPSSEETYSGPISGSGNLTFMSSATGGGGEVDLTSTLNGAFAGNTTVQNGVEVEFAHHTAFGSTGTIYVGTGGGTLEFDFAMSPVTNNLVLNHTGTISPGGYSGAGYANTWSGTISGTGGLIVSDASGPGGVLTLAPTSGANTYSGGTTVGDGTNPVTLAVNTDADLGNANGGLTFNNGTLSLTGATFSTSRPVALAGNGTISTSGVAEFFGSISGPGALTLDPTRGSSPGTIILSNANSYSGGTTVTSGTTVVAGNPDSLGSGLVALTGSTLETTTLETTNWVTGGTTGMPIDVGGAYTQDSASTLRLTISGRPSIPQEPSLGNYDYINMTNDSAVTLDPGTSLQLQFNGGFRPVSDFDKYIVIADTTGTITGTFTSITAHNDPTGQLYRFTDANLPGTGNVVTVQTLFSPFVNGMLFTGTPNENSVANYLDTYATAANTPLNLQNLLAQLSALAPTPTNPGNEIGPALDQLTPEAEQALGNLAISNSTFMSQTVFGQIEDQFDGMTAFNSAGLSVLDTPNADPFTAAMNGAMQSVAQQNSIESLDVNNGEPSEGGPVPIPGRESNRNTLSGFVSGNVILADLPGTGNGSQNFTTGGVIAGLDYNMCSHLAIGALFAYENTSATLDNHGSKLNNQSYTPGVYLGFHKSHFYVDALGSYTYNAYSMHRNITFTNPQSTASSSPHSNQYDASAMLGYNFHVRRGLKLGPAVGVGYTHINVAGYQESGSPADLMVQSMSVDSLRMLVGGRLNYGWSPRPTMTPINFSVNAFWQHEFLDGSRGITSTFTELGAGSFVIDTSPAGRDSALFGGGVSGNLAKNITLFVNYESQIGSQGDLGQTVMAGVAVALK